MFAAEAQPTPLTESPITQDITAEWQEIAAMVAPFLEEVRQQLAAQVAAFDPGIAPYAEYALASQGKQLRATLTGLAANSVGGWNDGTVKVAVIIEMVHLATLLHDDIMDGAALRRNRPTLARKWDSTTAVLVGDCLFANSLRLAAEFPTTDVCRAVSTATRTVCSGEILQNKQQGKLALSQAEYFKMLRMKTGELFALACELGGSLAGGDARETRALRDYGMALGTAYQVYDDCLDIFGSEAEAGKSLGTDIAGGKATLPVILLCEQAGPDIQPRLNQMIQRWDETQLNILRGWLSEFNTLERSQSRLESSLADARKALGAISESSPRDALEELTRFLAQQSAELGVG
ncbi:MAG: polyprenyl synthetase family protein [Verrucomicrobiota bacterium]|jgi:octaprenyl-diphosphate synthase|nr:polyprenyl synthetase family protein [Verrucomicrobiota bacterium]MDP7048237.1 polyprenyl synthetase family protein [Verrucomicrobiota bacterium]